MDGEDPVGGVEASAEGVKVKRNNRGLLHTYVFSLCHLSYINCMESTA